MYQAKFVNLIQKFARFAKNTDGAFDAQKTLQTIFFNKNQKPLDTNFNFDIALVLKQIKNQPPGSYLTFILNLYGQVDIEQAGIFKVDAHIKAFKEVKNILIKANELEFKDEKSKFNRREAFLLFHNIGMNVLARDISPALFYNKIVIPFLEEHPYFAKYENFADASIYFWQIVTAVKMLIDVGKQIPFAENLSKINVINLFHKIATNCHKLVNTSNPENLIKSQAKFTEFINDLKSWIKKNTDYIEQNPMPSTQKIHIINDTVRIVGKAAQNNSLIHPFNFYSFLARGLYTATNKEKKKIFRTLTIKQSYDRNLIDDYIIKELFTVDPELKTLDNRTFFGYATSLIEEIIKYAKAKEINYSETEVATLKKNFIIWLINTGFFKQSFKHDRIRNDRNDVVTWRIFPLIQNKTILTADKRSLRKAILFRSPKPKKGRPRNIPPKESFFIDAYKSFLPLGFEEMLAKAAPSIKRNKEQREFYVGYFMHLLYLANNWQGPRAYTPEQFDKLRNEFIPQLIQDYPYILNFKNYTAFINFYREILEPLINKKEFLKPNAWKKVEKGIKQIFLLTEIAN